MVSSAPPSRTLAVYEPARVTTRPVQRVIGVDANAGAAYARRQQMGGAEVDGGRALRPALFFTAIGLAAAAPTRSYDTYENARYGYHLCYPADLFRPGPEPDAGDGIVLSGLRGAKLTVSGMPSGEDKPTPAKIVEQEKDQGVSVTYRAQGPGWAVLSGASGQGLFYGRAIENDGRPPNGS